MPQASSRGYTCTSRNNCYIQLLARVYIQSNMHDNFTCSNSERQETRVFHERTIDAYL